MDIRTKVAQLAERMYEYPQYPTQGGVLFVDLEHGEFRFRPDSPALKLGIQQPFDVRDAGVQRRDYVGE